MRTAGGARPGPPWWAVRGAWVVFLCLALAGTGAAAPTVEGVLANLGSFTALLPPEMGFRQHIQLQVLFLTWRFHSDVVRQDGEFHVQTSGAPDFLSPDVPAALLELNAGLDDYELELLEHETNSAGDPVYVLSGRRRGQGPGAQAGTVWVNGRTWLVEKAVLEYDWGTLEVQQEFHQVDGYTVPRSQQAKASRLGARLVVEYRDYWFGNVERIAREDH